MSGGLAIVCVAPNGPRLQKSEDAGVPVSPVEIADEVARCAQAGAAIAHVHARTPDGRATQDVAIYADILSLIAQRCDIIVQISIGVRGFDLEEALRPISLKPEMASFPLRVAADGEGQDGMAVLGDLAGRMAAAGVLPELDASSLAMVEAGCALHARGAIQNPPCFGLVMGEPASAREVIESVLSFSGALPAGAHWWAAKGGRWQMELRAAALALGGHVRIGLEDLPAGFGRSDRSTNVRWVEQVVGLSRRLGREPATPDQARAMLGLRPRSRDTGARKEKQSGGQTFMNQINLTRRTVIAGLSTVPAVLAGVNRAMALPQGLVRIIVPFPAGGQSDFVSRLLVPALSSRLQRTVIVENRDGAGGVVGMSVVAGATNGMALGFVTTGILAITPHVMDTRPFDFQRDLATISRVAVAPGLLVANPRMPYTDLQGFLAYARQHPGDVTIASTGNGSLPHLAIELLRAKAGIDVTHVPYRGAGPATTDVLAGNVHAMIADINAFTAYVKAGKLRALALLTNGPRSPLLPETPTSAQAGLPDFEVLNWYGLVASSATPPDVQDELNRAVVGALTDPAVIKALDGAGAIPGSSSIADFKAFAVAESSRWGEIAQRVGAKLD